MNDKYSKIVNEQTNINSKARRLLLKQIKYFYELLELGIKTSNDYNVGDLVLLKKGTFLHGTRDNIEGFNNITKNGFISDSFTNVEHEQKYPYTIAVWNIKKDILLKDYITNYSGMTIGYMKPNNIFYTEMIPYGKIDEYLNELRKIKLWKWDGEQTKEIRFLPSLADDKVQIGFIINNQNRLIKTLIENDIFNKKFNKNLLKFFVNPKLIDSFVKDKKNCFTTDRESAIVFGLPNI